MKKIESGMKATRSPVYLLTHHIPTKFDDV